MKNSHYIFFSPQLLCLAFFPSCFLADVLFEQEGRSVRGHCIQNDLHKSRKGEIATMMCKAKADQTKQSWRSLTLRSALLEQVLLLSCPLHQYT